MLCRAAPDRESAGARLAGTQPYHTRRIAGRSALAVLADISLSDRVRVRAVGAFVFAATVDETAASRMMR
jgi:hypothetical protein